MSNYQKELNNLKWSLVSLNSGCVFYFTVLVFGGFGVLVHGIPYILNPPPIKGVGDVYSSTDAIYWGSQVQNGVEDHLFRKEKSIPEKCASASLYFKKATILAPEKALGYEKLARSLTCQDKYSESIPIFEKARQLYLKSGDNYKAKLMAQEIKIAKEHYDRWGDGNMMGF